MNHPTTNPATVKSVRCDEPSLSFAALLALTAGQPAIGAALRKHVGNILSRLSNEAQDQLLRADAWSAEADRAFDGTDALEQMNLCLGRAAALAWQQGALAAAFGMALNPVPFEVPKHWLKVPAEPVEPKGPRMTREEQEASDGFDAAKQAREDHLQAEFIAQGAERREEGGAPC